MGSFELILADYPSDASTEIACRGRRPDRGRARRRPRPDRCTRSGSVRSTRSARHASGYRRAFSMDNNTDGERMITLKLRVGVGSIDVRRDVFFDGPERCRCRRSRLPARHLVPLQFFGDGTVLFEDGSIDFGDGRRIEADGSLPDPHRRANADGSVQLDNGAVIRADGTVVTPGGFVIPRPPGATAPVPSTLAPVTNCSRYRRPSHRRFNHEDASIRSGVDGVRHRRRSSSASRRSTPDSATSSTIVRMR